MTKPTFTFKSAFKKRYQWDAVSKYGQTVKVIVGDGHHVESIRASATRWNKKMYPRIRLKELVRAQTFMMFEAVPCRDC